MITLITGGPGMGKTALAVQLLIEQYADRPIFSNINGLTLDHSPLPKFTEWTETRENEQGTSSEYYTFPPSAIVVIDECQQFFRPRHAQSKVPLAIQAFETHRHTGIDFILITQGSRLIDINLRSLVKGGLHIYLKGSFLSRYRYEKREVINEDDKASVNLAARRKYKLPSEVFDLYKSSELHTKPARPKLPIQAYIIIALLFLLPLGGYHLYNRFQDKTKSEGESIALQQGSENPAVVVSNQHKIANFKESLILTDPYDYLSAPIYASLPKPVFAPVILGCIAQGERCICYNQQLTQIFVPQPLCLSRVAGQHYDPFHEVVRSSRQDTNKLPSYDPRNDQRSAIHQAPLASANTMRTPPPPSRL